MRLVLASLTALLLAAPAAGQDLKRPDTWRFRPDRADADTTTLFFVGMPPGWHITTGPSGIMYDPARVAQGNYRLESEIFFFREKSRDSEGYGIVLGGRDLDGAADYVYFLLRNDGKFLVKHRAGNGDVHTIQDWTAHEAITRHTAATEGATVKNVITVDAGPENVSFSVNGTQVASFPRSHMAADGIVGLRVNHGLNLHVTKLDVTAR